MTDLAPDTDTLAGLLADATPGPWEAALETGCHGVVASVPPAGETKMVAIIGNSLESPELEPMRFANARLIALAPELAAEAIALRAQAAKDKARIERYAAALREAEETMKLVERPALPDPAYHQGVKSIGQRIGFGALMSTASAAWRETLEETGYPTGGEFVAGPCFDTVVSCLAKVRAALEDEE